MDGKTAKVANDWRDIPGTAFRINRRGELQSTRTGKAATPRRIIRTKRGAISTAKTVLWLFAGITPRPGWVNFRDGNRENFAVENLRYRGIDPAEVKTGGYASRAEMIESLKSRFAALKDNRGIFDTTAKVIIQTITERPGFRLKNAKTPYWDIFLLWLGEKNILNGLNEGEIARRENMTVREVKKIVDYFLGQAVEYVVPGRRKKDRQPPAVHAVPAPITKDRKNGKKRVL